MLNVDKYKSIRCCERFNILVGHQHRIFFSSKIKIEKTVVFWRWHNRLALALKANDPLMMCALAVGRHSFQRCIGELSSNEQVPPPAWLQVDPQHPFHRWWWIPRVWRSPLYTLPLEENRREPCGLNMYHRMAELKSDHFFVLQWLQ